MTNRRFNFLTFAAIALCALFIPSAANAQGSIWDRIRDRAEQSRDQNNRRDDDDRYGRRGGRISDNERRILRDTARRISDRSRQLERDIDRQLDNSRHDGTRREDDINGEARRFRDIANRFRNVAGDSNDLYRSQDEARELINAAQRLDRLVGRIRSDSRAQNQWAQIRNDLRTVADIYGLRFNGNGGYGNGGYGRDDRRDDRRDERRDDRRDERRDDRRDERRDRRDNRWPN
ncbi:MAG: hypothetical protein H7Z38_06395 [Rubrivivax sp.]|nr:hypothetical protein [Pyrinomonadaceae bacterium]